MKRILPLISALLFAGLLIAQPNHFLSTHHTIAATSSDTNHIAQYTSAIFPIAAQLEVSDAPFISCAVIVSDEKNQLGQLDVITILFGTTETTLQSQLIKVNSDIPQLPNRRVFGPISMPHDTKFWQFQTAISANFPINFPPAITITTDFFAPPNTLIPENQLLTTPRGSNAPPAYISRSEWNCPDKNTPSCGKNVIYDAVTHVLVHHSAGNTVSDNYGAVVLSYWNFHTKTNGWCDLGYNWLIDPKGVIYEGRGGGNNVRGAHFCGKNTNTMGICMIGEFQNNEPSAAAMRSLEQLLAWKTCDSHLNPTGTSPHIASNNAMLNVISGHRDGCETDCPGNNVYKRLAETRASVKKTKETACLLAATVDEIPKFDLNISPNPATQNCQITWEAPDKDPCVLKIFTMNGQQIAHYATQNNGSKQSFTFFVSDLAKGIYLVVYKSKHYMLRKKLIVR
jgi:N-acetylmuramoyl-L-alanine amidase/Secretion system C-terminal sorting domain